ncbi:hypothetical protein NPIL_398051, partial [Nephila pilipes]
MGSYKSTNVEYSERNDWDYYPA